MAQPSIRGWRLDVIDELPVPFLRQFYKTLKEENPDAVLIGEVWEDASNKVSYSEQREYLCGYDIDSAMNYAERALMVDFVTGAKEARRMNDELTRLRENYPPENFYAMLNLISSHDIERILTVLQAAGGTDVATAEDTAKKRLKLLTTWQMTMPGAPASITATKRALRAARTRTTAGLIPGGGKTGISWVGPRP